MLITIKTFDGHTLNSSDYETTLLNPHGGIAAKPVYLEQTEADALDAGTFSVDTQTKVLSIKIKDYGNRYALIAQLKTWFARGTQGLLVGSFSDEEPGATDYQLNCRVTELTPDPQNDAIYFKAILNTGQSAWRSVNEVTEDAQEITGTGGTFDIEVGGKDDTFLSLDITPTAGPESGFLYQNLLRIVNPSGVTLGRIAYCITVDTASLIADEKMQPDCDDLRLIDLLTGQEIKRWIANPDSATTKVWVNLRFGKGFSLVLKTDVAGTGDVPYLQFKTNDTTRKKIALMEKTGVIRHGNEWFSYTNTNVEKCRLVVGKRGLFGTTEEAHSTGDTFSYIQYPVMMKYGNLTIDAPDVDDENYDDEKPLINLSSSSNTSWVWGTTEKFYDPDHPKRTCAWKFSKKVLGANSKFYYVEQDAESGDPAIGFKVENYQKAGVWKAEQVNLNAKLTHKGIIANVSMTGGKYRSNANWLTARLRRSADNVEWRNLWSEVKPTVKEVWESWTHNGVSVSGNARYLMLQFSGSYPAAEDASAYFEGLTCTATISSSDVPTQAFLGEQDSYPLLADVENETTEETISLDYIMRLDKLFEIDGESQIVTYDGYPAYGSVSPDDLGRSVYLHLKGGVTNTITFSGDDLGTLSVVAHYYRRRL